MTSISGVHKRPDINIWKEGERQSPMNHHTAAASRTESLDTVTLGTQSALEPSLELKPTSRYETLVWIIQATISLIGVIVLSPLFLFIALVIKLTDGGPVFYSGSRVGQGKRIFRIHKFRSLAE